MIKFYGEVMDTIQIETNMYNTILKNKPTRFDMAINFYSCIKKDNKFYLTTYYYNSLWDLYYPFYDDINKTPIIEKCTSNTFGELVEETDKKLLLIVNEKLKQAHKRFFDMFDTNCTIKQSLKYPVSYELKYSKTSKQYSVYKLYNFIITNVEDKIKILKPKSLQCKLFELENLTNQKVVGNAIHFCKLALTELKEYAILI